MMLPAVISARFLERYERSVKSGCIELLTYAGRIVGYTFTES